ncbi:GAF domain-containing protein [Geomonas sp. Red32]|uniref:GAF domain-containing protein n=1 Tax=Geomonas sp. Red32 TaxID=2912856 RepID=UPI00202CECCB|nr:GAF domain-containing protein [Geomonas sp. Red32]MCM0081029.1 GAF domain-containing protein [Geomonas sp. Red32]
MQLVEICEKLEALLASRQDVDQKIAAAADALCRVFGVDKSEVAFFLYDPDQDCLNFAWPHELRNSGSIPISATRSLVANTAREKRAMINNSFASTPHLFVFEAYGKEKGLPIQRIMSVPILRDDQVRGVLQVSRKGTNDDGLKNFSPGELQALGEIARVIGRHV